MKIHKKNKRPCERLRQGLRGVLPAAPCAPAPTGLYCLPGEHGMAERIGDYLVRTGAMQKSQVDSVIAAQKAGDSRTFGEIAVALGFASRTAVDAYASSQRS
jgi:hypothetical protein